MLQVPVKFFRLPEDVADGSPRKIIADALCNAVEQCPVSFTLADMRREILVVYEYNTYIHSLCVCRGWAKESFFCQNQKQ